MIATAVHVTSGSGVSGRLICDGQRHAGCPYTASLMKISNTYTSFFYIFFSPHKLTWGIDISGMNFSLRSSSSSDDDDNDDDDHKNNNNNTCLLINVVPFNVASLEIHTGSTAISRPFEALREVQWLKLGTTFKPVFRLNRAYGRAISWCSSERKGDSQVNQPSSRRPCIRSWHLPGKRGVYLGHQGAYQDYFGVYPGSV